MKNFDDFLNSVDDNQLAIEAFYASYEGDTELEIISNSYKAFTITLLRAYHEWLTENFSLNDK